MLLSPLYSKAFSLLETLVAIVILAVGLLGMASLMIMSVQSNQSAAERSAAVVLSHQIVERMRNNTGRLDAYLGDPFAAVDPCLNNACALGMTADQLAMSDRVAWAGALVNQVPGSQAIITALPNNEYCIAIFWPENQEVMAQVNATPCGSPANGRAFSELRVTL